jgi:segregation and condensation protein A
MSYHVKLEVFEGPFDLLFHLIEKNEVDIYDIPIAEITRQYLDYIEAMQSLDLELASEFLLLAATLLAIKARMLLPKPASSAEENPEDGLDPRDELVEKLLEYKKYKNSAVLLEELELKQGKVFSRLNDPESFLNLWGANNPLEGLTLLDLVQAMHEVLADLVKTEQIQEIHREEITIKSKMEEMLAILTDNPLGISFQKLFSRARERIEVVINFLALLELIRMQRIRVRQSAVCAEIMIFPKAGGELPIV